ncbi:MAG TPA: histidine phosphatase family protein [Nocardioidaceae bacterium]|nr:histidine phosphatase family protein [Nocardioidaceae bacterium]
MSVILLVRHGQASFGAADYDKLSARGEEQGRILGQALRDRGIKPAYAVRGSMLRHRETAECAGFDDAVEDAGWNEFDHLQVLAAHTPPDADDAAIERRAFQRWFEQATEEWMKGGHDDRYDESFAAFTSRVDAALGRVLAAIAPQDTAVVFTSGGAIAAVASRLLGGGPDLWQNLNRVTTNASITKLVVGRSGTSMVSYNDHVHLEPDHVTYR